MYLSTMHKCTFTYFLLQFHAIMIYIFSCNLRNVTSATLLGFRDRRLVSTQLKFLHWRSSHFSRNDVENQKNNTYFLQLIVEEKSVNF